MKLSKNIKIKKSGSAGNQNGASSSNIHAKGKYQLTESLTGVVHGAPHVANLMINLSKEIENVSNAETAIAAIKNADQANLVSQFMLGGYLARVRKEKWYLPYETFGDFTFDKFGFQGRKADYLIKIYNYIIESGAKLEKFTNVLPSMMRDIASRADHDDAEYWLERAQSDGMTVLKLQQELKEYYSSPGDEGVSVSPEVMKFSFYPDQVETVSAAIDKAKEAGNTSHDSVALEYICLEYVGSNGSKFEPGQLIGLASNMIGIDGIIEHLASLYPNVDIQVTSPPMT